MQESNGRRKYDRQFKEEAVNLVIEGGRSVSDVARGLGIHDQGADIMDGGDSLRARGIRTMRKY